MEMSTGGWTSPSVHSEGLDTVNVQFIPSVMESYAIDHIFAPRDHLVNVFYR